MAQREDCFALYTPYGKESHYSHYLSLFGRDILAGETVSATARLVILSDPTEEEIVEAVEDFLATTAS
ncbi:MAG: hypothetical protein KTR25_18170 [Myxococcales bacterium]|nr:hypothetical protein [Myxococcales bacterium]